MGTARLWCSGRCSCAPFTLDGAVPGKPKSRDKVRQLSVTIICDGNTPHTHIQTHIHTHSHTRTHSSAHTHAHTRARAHTDQCTYTHVIYHSMHPRPSTVCNPDRVYTPPIHAILMDAQVSLHHVENVIISPTAPRGIATIAARNTSEAGSDGCCLVSIETVRRTLTTLPEKHADKHTEKGRSRMPRGRAGAKAASRAGNGAWGGDSVQGT